MRLSKSDSIALIEQLASKELMVELLYLRDSIDREDPPEPGDEDFEFYEPYDLLDAFEDASNQVDSIENCPKQWSTHIREIEIALGWWKSVTDEELSRTIVASTGAGRSKKYAFKHKGLKYIFDAKGK